MDIDFGDWEGPRPRLSDDFWADLPWHEGRVDLALDPLQMALIRRLDRLERLLQASAMQLALPGMEPHVPLHKDDLAALRKGQEETARRLERVEKLLRGQRRPSEPQATGACCSYGRGPFGFDACEETWDCPRRTGE